MAEPGLIAKYIFKPEGISNVKAQAAQLGGHLQNKGKTAGASFGKSLLGGISKSFSPAAIGTVVGAAVAGGLALSLKEFAGWESQVSGAVARMGINTSAAMEALDPAQYESNLARYESAIQNVGDVSKELGATTAFTSKEVAAGMENLAAVGVNVGTISTEAMKPFLDLANATRTALPESIEIQMASLKQFGLAVEESQRVADVFAATTGSSAANLQDLGKAMEYVGPTAAGLGYDIETVSAYIGTLRDNGFVASKAGTSLNNMFSRLSGASPRVAKYMEEIGLTMDDVNPRAHSLTDIMRTIGEAAGIPADGFALIADEMKNMEAAGLSDEEMFERLSEQGGSIGQFMKVFGLEAGPAALALLKNADAADQLADSLHAVEGVASEVARQQIDNLSGAITIMMSGVSGLMIQIGGLIAPYAMQLVSSITQTVIPAASKAVSGVAAIFGTLGKLLSPVLKPIGAIIKVTFGNMAAYAGAIYSGFKPLITIIKKVADHSSKMGDIWADLVSNLDISDQITAFGEFSQQFNVIGISLDKLGPKWDDAKSYATAFIDEFMALESVQNIIESAKEWLSGLADDISDLPENASKAWDSLKDSISETVDNIKSTVFDAFDIISKETEGITAPIKTAFGKVRDFVYDTFDGIVDDVYEKLKEILEPILKIAEPFADQLGESYQGISDFFDRVEARANDLDIAEEMAKAGEDGGESFTEGVDESTKNIATKVESNLESTDGKKAGKKVGDDFAEGFLEGSEEIRGLSKAMMDSMHEANMRAIVDESGNITYESRPGGANLSKTVGAIDIGEINPITLQYNLSSDYHSLVLRDSMGNEIGRTQMSTTKASARGYAYEELMQILIDKMLGGNQLATHSVEAGALASIDLEQMISISGRVALEEELNKLRNILPIDEIQTKLNRDIEQLQSRIDSISTEYTLPFGIKLETGVIDAAEQLESIFGGVKTQVAGTLDYATLSEYEDQLRTIKFSNREAFDTAEAEEFLTYIDDITDLLREKEWAQIDFELGLIDEYELNNRLYDINSRINDYFVENPTSILFDESGTINNFEDIIVDLDKALETRMKDIGQTAGNALEDGIISVTEQQTLVEMVAAFDDIGGDSSDALIQAILAGDYDEVGRIVADRFGETFIEELNLFGGRVSEALMPKKSLQELMANPEDLKATVDNFYMWREHTYQPALSDFISDAYDIYKSGYASQAELDENYFDLLTDHLNEYSNYYRNWQYDLIKQYESGQISPEQFFDIWDQYDRATDSIKKTNDKTGSSFDQLADKYNNLASTTAEATGVCCEAMSDFGKAQESSDMFFKSFIGTHENYIKWLAETGEYERRINVGFDFPENIDAEVQAYKNSIETALGSAPIAAEIDTKLEPPTEDAIFDVTSTIEEAEATIIPGADLNQDDLNNIVTEINTTQTNIPVGMEASQFWLDYNAIVRDIRSNRIYIPVDVSVVANIPAIVTLVKSQIQAGLYS